MAVKQSQKSKAPKLDVRNPRDVQIAQQRINELRKKAGLPEIKPSSSGGSSSASKSGKYDASKGGFVTSDGKVYPTNNPSFVPQGYTSETPSSGGVSVSPGGTVKTYDSKGETGTFIGKAVIPGTNLTATEYARQVKQDAINKGLVARKDISKITFTGYLPTKQVQQQAQEKILYNQKGEAIGVESGYLGKSIAIENYNKELERIKSVLPQEKYFNPATGQVYDKKNIVIPAKGVDITNTPVRVYVDPQTNKPIQDLNKYVQEKNIPRGQSQQQKVITFEEAQKSIYEPIYDIKSIPSSYYPRLDTGQASPLLNVGPDIDISSFKAFGESYLRNIKDIESTKSAIDTALILKTIPLALSKEVYQVPIKFTKKLLETRAGKLFLGGVATAEITAPVISKLDERFLPQPKTKVGKFSKAVVEGAVITSSPYLAGVYLEQLGKSVVTKGPAETIIEMGVNYPETLGYIAGGSLRVKTEFPGLRLEDMKFAKDLQKGKLGFGTKEPLPEKLASFFEKLDVEVKVAYEVPFKKTFQKVRTLTVDKLLGTYKPVETSIIGEKKIKGAKGTKGEFDIGLIPERGAKPEINAELIKIQEVITKENPIVRAEGEFQKKVLEIVKKNQDVLGGSFAGKVLFEGTRKPGDIDIISKDPLRTAQDIQAIMPEVTVKPHKVNKIDVVAVEDIFGNKADIVSIKGYRSVRKFFGLGGLKTVKVGEFKVLRPEDLLKKKAEALESFGLMHEKTEKTIKDIEAYTKQSLGFDPNKATQTGPYGFTPKELEAYAGKTGTVAHSSTGFFAFFNKKFLQELNKQEKSGKFFNILEDKKQLELAKESGGFEVLFGTPFDIKTGQAQTRVTRLGKEASLKDISSGEFTFDKPVSTPQIIIFENQKISSDIRGELKSFSKQFRILKKSSELEVGLDIQSAPGVPNVLRKKAKAGVTLIDGQRVEILIGEIVKGNSVLDKKTLDSIKQLEKGQLTEKKLKKLNEDLYKQTGIEQASSINKPYFDLNRIYSKALKQSQKSMSASIEKNMKSIYSNLSRDLRTIASKPSSPSQPSRPSTPSRGRGSTPSIPSYYTPYPELERPIIAKVEIRREKKKSKPSQTGYNVYGKQLKSNKYLKINNYALSKSRAEDIGAYYVANTLARSFKIEKTGTPAQEDYQFVFIPAGFFKSTRGTLREYKIRNRQVYETPEAYIQKSRFALSSESEKRQIQAFRKQVENALKF